MGEKRIGPTLWKAKGGGRYEQHSERKVVRKKKEKKVGTADTETEHRIKMCVRGMGGGGGGGASVKKYGKRAEDLGNQKKSLEKKKKGDRPEVKCPQNPLRAISNKERGGKECTDSLPQHPPTPKPPTPPPPTKPTPPGTPNPPTKKTNHQPQKTPPPPHQPTRTG